MASCSPTNILDRVVNERCHMTKPRFSADEMLGSLARWLRIMGYDTRYERDSDDSDILERAKLDDRVLLTRDKNLAERAGKRALYIHIGDLDDQVGQVARAFDLVFDEDLSRCTACNGELVLISKEEASNGVPDGALLSNEQFFRCGSCGKYYWKGSHWKNIRKRMAVLTRPAQESSR
jgi:uncharacterized protein with PIN domain